MEIYLQPDFFADKERIIARNNSLECSLFTYGSGVKAARLSNKNGYIVILPYMGQMIWDINFNGRSLKMSSFIDEPSVTEDFLETYGCFLMHCGALRMGCPSPQDTHPLHGELPVAPYKDVTLFYGRSEDGDYIGITGQYVYRRAFGSFYTARPVLKLYENAAAAELEMNIKNRANDDMELMYMAHINFLPKDGAKICQPASWDAQNMRLRKNEAGHLKTDPRLEVFFDKIAKTPEYTQNIRKEDPYNPEAVFFIDKVCADEDGYAHFMQILPDGTADYISYRTNELGRCVRQYINTPDMQSLGLALPSTCEPEGYIKERAKGNIKILKPGEEFSAKMKFGVLDKKQAESMKEKIERTFGSDI